MEALFVCLFLQPHLQHMDVPELGVESEPQLRSIPQPQQHWSWTTFVTYPTACSNARSLTSWVRPEVKPTTLPRLCQFLTHCVTVGTPDGRFWQMMFGTWVTSLKIPGSFFPLTLLGYNWQIKLYIFKVCKVIICYTYTLWNDYDNHK